MASASAGRGTLKDAMKRSRLLLTFALALGMIARVSAYLTFGVQVDGRSVTLRWNRLPIRYFVTDRAVPGVSVSQFQAAADRAFGTWQTVPTASVTFQFGGVTSAIPFVDDGITALGFDERPELDRVLAATRYVIDDSTGEIVESDIFFNTLFPWSVASSGEPGRIDFESVALHEIGHVAGLGHSAIGETEMIPGGRRVIAAGSVMFPIAFSFGTIAGRRLQVDDVAGISVLYPDGDFEQETGGIVGRVLKGGRGVFGAHVVAFNPETGKLIANFSLTDQGDFTIAGLDPGPHVIRVEPLDDADVDSFFDPESKVDVDFRATFYDRLVVAPRGGASASIEITVTPK